MYHALAVKGALPVGSVASSVLPAAGVAVRKPAPLGKKRELLAAPNTPVEKAAAPEKKARPSACAPERRNTASAGPAKELRVEVEDELLGASAAAGG